MPLSLPFFTDLVIYPSLLFCFHKSPHWRIMIIMINCRVVNAHLNYWQKHITDFSLFFSNAKKHVYLDSFWMSQLSTVIIDFLVRATHHIGHNFLFSRVFSVTITITIISFNHVYSVRKIMHRFQTIHEKVCEMREQTHEWNKKVRRAEQSKALQNKWAEWTKRATKWPA